MGGFFQSFHDAITGGGEQKRAIDRQHAQQDLDDAQARRVAQQQDLEFHNHIQALGALPVINGMVKRPGFAQTYTPGDDSATPKSNIEGVADAPSAIPAVSGQVPTTILDKAGNDGRHVIKMKDADGNPVSYEIPTAEEQIARSGVLAKQGAEAGAPAADLLARQKGQANQYATMGSTLGSAQGATQGEIEDLDKRGVTLAGDDAKRLRVPEGTRVTPEQLATLSGKIAPVDTRADAASALADKNNAARANLADKNNVARNDRQDARLQQAEFEKKRDADLKQHLQLSSQGVQAGGGPLAPIKLQLYNAQQQQLDLLSNKTQQLMPQINAGQDLADVKDGESFVNPFTHQTQQMNGVTRLQIMKSTQAAQQQYQQYDQQKQAIAKGAGLNVQPGQGTHMQAAPQGGAPAPQGTPVQGGAPQAANVPRGTPQAPHDPYAEAIANYNAPPPSSRGSSPRALATNERIMARIRAIRPDYDPTEYQNKVQAQKAFGAGGKEGEKSLALNTLVHHSDDLLSAIDKLGNGNFTPANAGVQELKRIFGNADITNFDQLKSYVAGETVKLIAGGGGTGTEQEEAERKIKESNSPDELKGAVDTNFGVAGGKMRAMNQQARKAHLGDKFSVLDPDAAAIMKSRGYDTETFQKAQPAGLPQQAVAALKEGIHTTFGNGQVWTLQKGVPRQIK